MLNHIKRKFVKVRSVIMDLIFGSLQILGSWIATAYRSEWLIFWIF